MIFIWYSSAENMRHIVKKLKKSFIIPVKSNRLVALSEDDWKKKNFVQIKSLNWDKQSVKIWMKGIDFPLLANKQCFTNKDKSTGVIYLVTNDLDCTKEKMEKVYKKRWSIEVFHKTLKQNASLAKSPTKRVRTQTNHIFMAIVATAKLELLTIKENTNHFALKSKLYTKAIKIAFQELYDIKQKYKEIMLFA